LFALSGENRGSSALGSANEINYLIKMRRLVSNNCPINIYGQCMDFDEQKICACALCRPNRRDGELEPDAAADR
jgi:hypothetical protein